DDGFGGFRRSPDGKQIAYTSTDPRSDADKEREKKFGEFDVIDGERRQSHLWILDVTTKKARRLTVGAYNVGRFSWSPDGKEIAFDHTIDNRNANGGSADISVVEVAG